MPRLETSIERAVKVKVLDWAKERDIGVLFLKLSIIGMAGFPDRLILWEGGHVLFVEFKQAKKKPRPLQHYIFSILTGLGFEVQVHDDVTRAVSGITGSIAGTTALRP